MQSKLRSTVTAVLLLAPAAGFVALPAQAQSRTAAAPAVTNMSLNSDGGLSAGATLRVQIYATPNARSASLQLAPNVTVPLRQQSPGNYTGSYVVRRADRIDPMQLMTARVTFGDRTYSRQFNYPPSFQALAMGAAAPVAPAPMRLVMRNAGRLEPGRELHFRVEGQPGGDAWLDIPGVINGVDLGETRPGVYEGTYTVRRRDDPDAFRTAVATLRNGSQRATARLDLNAREDDWRDREDRRAEREERREERRADRMGNLPLEVTSHDNNAVVDANGQLPIRGRTVPFANVRVQVESVANVGGVLGLTQPVADQTVQSDRNGNFAVTVVPRGLPIPGTRFDVRLTATNGNQTAEERITLIQRRG